MFYPAEPSVNYGDFERSVHNVFTSSQRGGLGPDFEPVPEQPIQPYGFLTLRPNEVGGFLLSNDQIAMLREALRIPATTFISQFVHQQGDMMVINPKMARSRDGCNFAPPTGGVKVSMPKVAMPPAARACIPRAARVSPPRHNASRTLSGRFSPPACSTSQRSIPVAAPRRDTPYVNRRGVARGMTSRPGVCRQLNFDAGSGGQGMNRSLARSLSATESTIRPDCDATPSFQAITPRPNYSGGSFLRRLPPTGYFHHCDHKGPTYGTPTGRRQFLRENFEAAGL